MSSWVLWPFHVQAFCFSAFVNFHTSHTFIFLRLRILLHHTTSFLDIYERFTFNSFLSWWVRTFHVTYLYFLTVLDISRQNPFFLGNYECFPSNPWFIDGYGRFSVKKAPESTNGVFLPNLNIYFLFPSLLLAYNTIGSRLVTFQSVRHSNGFC